ncbi:MAG: ATP-binding cassette domain-containing protein [Acidobacteriota bacterium]|jgi:ATP-binding cassette subfamily F protein uup|nr:ATP-binding cassette domain-containing protein [Acidobacteriota bacterium]
MALLTLDHVSLAHGYLPLLDGASLQIEPGERVCVLGRNGTGKSTLLRILCGDAPPDAGTVHRQPGMRTALLQQDAALADPRPVFEVVADGLGALGELAAAYHRAAVEVAEGGGGDALERLGRLQVELEERDGWGLERQVELVLSRLRLRPDASADTLSGGWKRRVLLAKALVGNPELLLLDEPTNHLDIDAIAWLEGHLAEYAGTVVFVTHDRSFVQRVATRIVELDRGRLTSWPGDYATYLRRKEEWLASESLQQEKFDKKLAEEEAWLRQGIKARRTRNEGRVRALLAMREERKARRERTGAVRLRIEPAAPPGRMVYEAEGVGKSFPAADGGAIPVVRGFSVRIQRGDRIGVLGPNGAGKTTLLRMLLGELPPDEGVVRQGAKVQAAYYDQQREQLDPERTIFDTIGEGNETVTAGGVTRHVNGYLQDFLFPPERARAPVKALSGGERNRLLLARLFTRQANVLVLDEPTNDLDLETLELLEAQLLEFPGTVLLVSHDRAFLDNVVTSMLVFEGGGRVQEYIGGYGDWESLRKAEEAAAKPSPRRAEGKAASDRRAPAPAADAPRKLSYNERRELDRLPGEIECLEAEQAELDAAVASPDFYKEAADRIKQALARQEEIQRELLAAYARWDELDSRSGK